ncbi:DUF2891 family protein [Novosphingobium olei]|uniref:DUF2891 family protein n=1 Tax=Novosphingobium olei TaxID=2728851 RepID=UPI003092DDBA|nr:DUF2891 domain-containing protein [Novosphingobium olei]
MIRLTPELAARMARSTRGHLRQPYPHYVSRLIYGPEELVEPFVAHPIFHGSFDWHSCVHGWWQVLRLARLFPDLPELAGLGGEVAELFTPAHVAGEIAMFERPGGGLFERPYGWAWLLALHLELTEGGHKAAAHALEPLARLLAGYLRDYLLRLDRPVRSGTHGNTAFAMGLALDWAHRCDPALADTIIARAQPWFASERLAPWLEPSGEDFLSPSLCVAALVARVFEGREALSWIDGFMAHPDILLLEVPVKVSDRSDVRIVHLDGLNLSRGWVWALLARVPGLPADAAARAEQASQRHIAAALPHIAGDYAGEHWLASFALLALTLD